MIGSRVILRKACEADIEARRLLGRHPEVLRGFGIALPLPEPMSLNDAETWVWQLMQYPNAWVIEHRRRLIGEIRLDNVDQTDRRASLAAGIYDPKLLDQGLGFESAMLCLAYAFKNLKLHCISVRVLASNSRAIACYRKCGFREEGREREAVFVNGAWEDDIIMGLLEDEFCRS